MTWLRLIAGGKWRAGTLALALVLAQSIAVLHGIAHASLLSHNPAAEAASESAHGFVERLFGDHHDHDGNAKCRLFDQCNHLDGLSDVPLVALPTPLSHVVPLLVTGLLTARMLAPFQARGPPSLR